MVLYYPLTVARTDGCQEYTVNGIIFANCPKDVTTGQDAKGRVYNKLDKDSPKHTRWRAMLGNLLMQQINRGVDEGKQYILEDLPEGYALWEHTGEAGDANTRSDTYMYGHPGGRTKRFRSCQDFLPHLYWLTYGLNQDASASCTCKLCWPSQKEEAPGSVEESTLVPPKVAPPKTVPVPTTRPSASSTIAPPAVSTARLPAPKSVTPQASIPPASVAPPRSVAVRPAQSREQIFDSQPDGMFLYRPGELVWFNKGAAWGLAVIYSRQAQGNVAEYQLQPLSHPLKHPLSVKKTQELIRPWLAWSVPNVTHTQISGLTYDKVPWDSVVNGSLGKGDAEVDGSILAAKAIDGSYTFFDSLNIPTAAPGETHYAGMFLGAEKLWVGEPIRMRPGNDDVAVMVIQQIIERITGTGSTVALVGDMYKWVEMPTPYKNRSEWPTPNLPPRMVADLRFRNEVADNARTGRWHEWSLVEPRARKSMSDVKGRWYETKALLPILRTPAAFQDDVNKGVTSDIGMYMNARGDSSSRTGHKKANRLDALGRAVPSTLRISRGLDESPPTGAAPSTSGHHPGSGQLQYYNLNVRH